LPAAYFLLLRLPIDPLGRIPFELLDGARIQSKQVREFRQVDTFRSRRLFVASKDTECQHVERAAVRVVVYTCDNLGERSRLRQFVLDDAIDSGNASLIQNRGALLVADRSVRICSRYRKADDLKGLVKWVLSQ